MPDRIRLQLDNKTLNVAPGDSAEVHITLTNKSDVVDAFSISVVGLDAAWYTLSTTEVRLYPKYSSEVTLKVHPPARSEAQAGAYSFSLLVISQDSPLESASEVVTVLLPTTGNIELGLEPTRVVGREGLYAIILANAGNSDVSTVLEATDPAEGLRYTLGTPRTRPVEAADSAGPRPPLDKVRVKKEGRLEQDIEVPAASIVTVPLLVKPCNRIWVGNGREVPLIFTVGTHPPGVEWEPGEAKQATAMLAYKPVFGALAGLPVSMQRALGVLFLVAVLAILVGLTLAGANALSPNNTAAASVTQTAVAFATQQTADALSLAGTQTAAVSAAQATQTALAGALTNATLDAAGDGNSFGGIAFRNNFRLRVPQGNAQPDFIWDVTSVEDVKITQARRPVNIPNLETSRLVDYKLQATGMNNIVTNTSSLLFMRPPLVELLAGNPITVTRGQTTTLSWQAKAAVSGTIDGTTVNLGPQGSGQLVVTPTLTHRYILCASNRAGSSCRSVKIWVIEGGAGFGPASDRTSCAPTTVNVGIKNGTFDAKNLVITAGSTLRWTNSDKSPYAFSTSLGSSNNATTVANNTIPPGQSYQQTFTSTGTLTFRIGTGPGQAGLVTVVPPCTPTPTSTTTPSGSSSGGTLDIGQRGTPTSTRTATATRTSTPTPTATSTATPTLTLTTTPTLTATSTATSTPSLTETERPTQTRTFTPTFTRTDTATNTRISTHTNTATYTRTPTITLTITPSNTLTPTLTLTITPTPTPTGDAYLLLDVNVDAGRSRSALGSCVPPRNGGRVGVGCTFSLDLLVNSGTHDAKTQRSYMTFTYGLLQNVEIPTAGSSCVFTSSTIVIDDSYFSVELQNEVCNGPDPCNFPIGGPTQPGSIAFASEAADGCEGCSGEFRVAQVRLCTLAPGQATIHWQFSPPGPPERDTEIFDFSGLPIHGRGLFTDYTFLIVDDSITVTPTPEPELYSLRVQKLSALDSRPVPGWTMDLFAGSACPASTPIARGVTDDTGVVTFTVGVGSYSVREELRSGWTPTTATCQNITISESNSPVRMNNASPRRATPDPAKSRLRSVPDSPFDVSILGSPLSVVVRPSGSYGVYRNGVPQFFSNYAEGLYMWLPIIGTPIATSTSIPTPTGSTTPDPSVTPTPIVTAVTATPAISVWGPEVVPAGNVVNLYTPLGTLFGGDGSANNPWIVTTTLGIAQTSLVLTQTVAYVNGENYIRNRWILCNCGGPSAFTNIHLFHAADLFTAGDDNGYGYSTSTGGAGGLNEFRTLAQVFEPVTSANNRQADNFRNIWAAIGDISGPGPGFNNLVSGPDQFIDNGAGLEWIRNLPVGGVIDIVDHITYVDVPQALVTFRNLPPPSATVTVTPNLTPVISPIVTVTHTRTPVTSTITPAPASPVTTITVIPAIEHARSSEVIPFPFDGAVTSEVKVSGSGVISGITLRDLNIEKRSDRFAVGYLTAPDGHREQVFNWPQCKSQGQVTAASYAYMKNVTLDDSAQERIPYACGGTISGVFRSDPGRLQKFNGLHLSGPSVWKLTIYTGPPAASTPTPTKATTELPTPALDYSTETPMPVSTSPRIDTPAPMPTEIPSATTTPNEPVATTEPTKQPAEEATHEPAERPTRTATPEQEETATPRPEETKTPQSEETATPPPRKTATPTRPALPDNTVTPAPTPSVQGRSHKPHSALLSGSDVKFLKLSSFTSKSDVDEKSAGKLTGWGLEVHFVVNPTGTLTPVPTATPTNTPTSTPTAIAVQEIPTPYSYAQSPHSVPPGHVQQPNQRSDATAGNAPGAASSADTASQIFSIALVAISAIMLAITMLLHIRQRSLKD